jgi:hypothetical protein
MFLQVMEILILPPGLKLFRCDVLVVAVGLDDAHESP